MQLQEKAPSQIVALTLNVDFDEAGGHPSGDLLASVRSMLERLEITCQNLICSEPRSVALAKLGVSDIPAVLIYDRSGNVHRRFAEVVDYDEVESVVDELVQSSVPAK